LISKLQRRNTWLERRMRKLLRCKIPLERRKEPLAMVQRRKSWLERRMRRLQRSKIQLERRTLYLQPISIEKDQNTKAKYKSNPASAELPIYS